MTGATQTSAEPGDVLVRSVAHPHSVRTARQLVGGTLRSSGRSAVVDAPASDPELAAVSRGLRDEVHDQIRGARPPLPDEALHAATAGADQSRTA